MHKLYYTMKGFIHLCIKKRLAKLVTQEKKEDREMFGDCMEGKQDGKLEVEEKEINGR